MAKKFVNLSELDWDDTALRKAYSRCMKEKQLEAGDLSENENEKESKRKWKVGDFCQALYPGDDLMYEAKILSLSDDTCVVDFLGYDEELEVDIATLAKSRGKKSRKKQIKRASRTKSYGASADESASDIRNSISTPVYSKKKVHDSNPGNHTFNHSVDYPAVESTFQQTMYPAPAHCSAAPPPPPPPPVMVPQFSSLPHCSELSQNSSLTAMITSWYMAGYYTGFHQGQKSQRRCCHASQNCCH